jgi:serine/threonine protein kinase
MTRTGMTLGTLAYMSPEQLRGEAVDARSDIFSFGLVLYEMSTGMHPVRKESPMETGSAILHQEPEPVGSITQGIPGRRGQTAPICEKFCDRL